MTKPGARNKCGAVIPFRPSPGPYAMPNFTAPIPLAVYVHLPWCVRKCPYCDFNSHAATGPLPEAAYVDALLADLEHELPGVWGRRVDTVFIGGGTPSLFSPDAIDRLLAGLRARLPLRPDAEITLEANPGSVEAGRYAELRAAGITRLSIGVQSFDDDQLGRLGRIHGRREAMRAAEAAHAAGYPDGFNLDLMYGLEQQTPATALADLAIAIDLEPAHLSHYQLTLEPNTLFHARPPVLPDDDTVADIEAACRARLEARGYERYEISAYAQPGRRCRHNLNYWEFGDYLGLGAGAHGKRTDPHAGEIRRTRKARNPRDYLETAPRGTAGHEETVPEAELPFEFLLNALRLIDGVPAPLYAERTGLALEALEAPLATARARGLLEADPQRLRASAHGLQFVNDLLQLFMTPR